MRKSHPNRKDPRVTILLLLLLLLLLLSSIYGRLALSFFRLSSLLDVLAADPRLNMPKAGLQ